MFNLNHPEEQSLFTKQVNADYGKPASFTNELHSAINVISSGAQDSGELRFVDKDGEIKVESRRAKQGLRNFLYSNSVIYNWIEDVLRDVNREPQFNGLANIKDIETRPKVDDAPPLSVVTRHEDPSRDLALELNELNIKFFVFSHLPFYYAGEDRLLSTASLHPYGLSFTQIPERRLLQRVLRELGPPILICWRSQLNAKFLTQGIYHNPRFAYFNEKGTSLIADLLCEQLSNESIL